MKYLKNITGKNIEGVELINGEGKHYKLDVPVGDVVGFATTALFKVAKATINKKVIECDKDGKPLE